MHYPLSTAGSARFTFRFLGSGTSAGVPIIGCTCPVCTSTDPRDNRMRSSLYVTLGDRALIIDTGPDFRMQCLRFRVPRIDAVFLTHLHADHIFGFDDIRRYNTLQNNQVIRCYCGHDTLEGMRRIFPYITEKPNTQGLFRPMISFVEVSDPFEALGATLTPLPVIHGPVATFGLRIDFAGKSLAYVPDVHEFPESTLSLMHGLDVLILNMLRDKPHPTHLTRERAVAYATQIGAKRTWFTHFSHIMPHADLEKVLPPGMAPAYDGLAVSLSEQ